MESQSSKAMPRDCGDCSIRRRSICAHCEATELEQLDQIKYFRNFEAGQQLIWAGDRIDFVGSVVSGVATLTQGMEDGRTQMVGLLLPGDFLGRPGRDIAAFDVEATTDLVMCCFRRKPFEDLISKTPHIAQRLLEMMLDDLDAAREWMMVLGRKTAREKVASLLTIFARRNASVQLGTTRDPLVFEIPLTRAAMASYLGLSLESVSRQISALRRDDVIDLVSKQLVTVPDVNRLIEEAGDDSDGGIPA